MRSGWKAGLGVLATAALVACSSGDGGGGQQWNSGDPSSVADSLPHVIDVDVTYPADPEMDLIVEQAAVTVRPASSDPREADSVGTFKVVEYTQPQWADFAANLNLSLGGYSPQGGAGNVGKVAPNVPVYKLTDRTLLVSDLKSFGQVHSAKAMMSAAATVNAADHLGFEVDDYAEPVNLRKVYGPHVLDGVLREAFGSTFGS